MHRIRAVMVLGALAVVSTRAPAQAFNGGIPAGWTCIGNCGTSGANGVVTLAPSGGTQYGYVSTNTGAGPAFTGGLGEGIGATSDQPGPATNGTVLRSPIFTANAGDALNFYFNYVTTDGAGFADYAWARVLDPDLNQVALLFTARTVESGSIVPGQGMPLPGATLNPATVAIIDGGPVWSPLGDDSGACFDVGCGYTGWVSSTFTLLSGGNYILEFGVTNWTDQAYDSGLAIDGIQVAGVDIGEQPPPPPPTTVPEPATMTLFGTGVVGLAGIVRRRRAA